MARFTADAGEIQHLQDIDRQLVDVASKNGWRVKIVMHGGRMLTGFFGGSSGGNNFGQGGFLAFYGDAPIVDDKGLRHVIDRLDILKVEAPERRGPQPDVPSCRVWEGSVVEVPNVESPRHRTGIIDQVREMAEAHFPGKTWADRCPHVAFHTMYVLTVHGLSGYDVVAGRVEETATGKPIYEGTYTGTGSSNFHTRVAGPDGKVLDFSVVPRSYGNDCAWADSDALPALRCIPLEATTAAVRTGILCTCRSKPI